MSMLFRAVQENDFDGIWALATESGIGITTLPKEKAFLQSRVQKALDSFKQSDLTRLNQYYLFVLEDTRAKCIVGTAAIEAMTGQDGTPFYSYEHIQEFRKHENLNIEAVHEYLIPSYKNQGYSELCTLYLKPSYRHSGNGLLLSLARFLFIYHFPERFTSSIIAELRGVSDENGESPFWDAVGSHFYKMSFAMADQLTLSNKQFILDLMPSHPIYLNLLSPKAQSVIGVPHSGSAPAMKILLKEGFSYNQTVDIFDAGPTLQAECKNIKTIYQAKTFDVAIENNLHPTDRYLLSNTGPHFKAVHARALLVEDKCLISSEVAQQLQLTYGDKISTSFI